MKTRKVFAWIITSIVNLMLYILIGIHLKKYLVCEYVYLTGTTIFSLLYFFKGQKEYLKEVSSVFVICAIVGLSQFSTLQTQGILFLVLLVLFVFLQRYVRIRK